VNRIEQQTDIETILEVPDTISKQSKARVCIAFDEFQEIHRTDPFLLNWMRSSFQRQKNVCYIFLGSKQSMMEDIFASARSPFYGFAVKMNLSVIDRAELFKFIKEKFIQYNLDINDQTIDSILKISDCQPHYTQFFASVVFDQIRSGHDQDAADFKDRWFRRIIYSQVDIF
jgi:hypothetical protein